MESLSSINYLCNVCYQRSTSADPLIRCYDCGLVVHRFCYGVTEYTSPWRCHSCKANEKWPMCAICKLTTKDPCIRCGHNEWCHVICAELISQTQFIHNNNILNLLLASFSAEGLRIPQSIKAQEQIITMTKLFIILPSECVLVAPNGNINKTKQRCAICKEIINGTPVGCCHSNCPFYAHPVCLARRDVSQWGFVVDNEIPCTIIRVVCANHLPVFAIPRFSIYRSFPQISSICVHACERALQKVMHQENLQRQYYDHNQAIARQACITRSQTRREGKIEKQPYQARAVAHRTRSMTASHDELNVKMEVAQSGKKKSKVVYTVKDFVKDVEYSYFTPHQQKFWLFYQNVDCEPSFKDVVPVSSKPLKPNDYMYRKNVHWDYSRSNHLIPMANRYRIVKCLLQGNNSAEITYMVYMNDYHQGYENSIQVSDELLQEYNKTTKSRIVFQQQGHGDFSTNTFIAPTMEPYIEAIVLEARVITTDHSIAYGANDPLAFEIRNLNKNYHHVHQANWSMINEKLQQMNNDEFASIKQLSQEFLQYYSEQCRWKDIQLSLRNGLCDLLSAYIPFVDYLSLNLKCSFLRIHPVCSICFSDKNTWIPNSRYFGDNPIIHCQKCGISVHIKCAGIVFTPDDPFICDACTYLESGGNPHYLSCCYCPIRDGYLRRIPSNALPKFAHILCGLFSPGSEISNFLEMTVSSEGLSITYDGMTMFNPASATHDELRSRASYSRISQIDDFCSFHDVVLEIDSKVNLSVPIFRLPQENVYYNQIDCSFSIKPINTHLNPTFLKGHNSSLVVFYNQCQAARNRISYKSLDDGFKPQIKEKLQAYHVLQPNTLSSCEYSESRDLAIPGGLCCYCLIPRGITIRCSGDGCNCSYHFYCHFVAGGYIGIPKICKNYIGGGKGISFVSYCKNHELCRATVNQLSQLLYRNTCRANQRLNNSLTAKLLMTNCSSLWNGISKSTEVEKVGKLTQLNRFCERCDICGYSTFAPPMNMDISLEENSFGRSIRLNSFHSSIPPPDGDKSTKYSHISSMWDSLLSLKSLNTSKPFLSDGVRGQMLKCTCCGCTVHEKCLDCPSYHVITNDTQFGYIICPSCLLGLRSGQTLRASSKVPCSFAKCCVCDLEGGFMVLTVDNRWVHKRCGILLRNSIYNNFESHYAKTGVVNPIKALSRTLVQFVIPSSENLGLVSNEEYDVIEDNYCRTGNNHLSIGCHICEKKKGRFVKCSMNNCNHYFHLSCLDRRKCYYASTSEGLEVLCSEHLPTNFSQDPLSSIWLPSNYTNLLFTFMQHEKVIKSCLDSVRKIEENARKNIVSLQNEVNSLFSKVNQIKENVVHFYRLNNLQTFATIGKIVIKPWTLTKDGISEIQPIVDSCTAHLQRMIEISYDAKQSAPSTNERSSDPPKIKAETESTNRKNTDEEEGFSEEEYLNDYEITTKKASNSRVVSSQCYNRMKVRSDDFIITSKELHHRNHQIFINISRLQDLIRNEGRKVESDPFIQYVSKLDERYFVDSKQFDKVIKASENMRNLKRTNHPELDYIPAKIPKTAMTTIKSEPISPKEEKVYGQSVKMEEVDVPARSKVAKQKQSKNTEKRKRVSEYQEFYDEPELLDSEMKKLEEEDKNMEKIIEEVEVKPVEWQLHLTSDTRYHNYQSLFPSPEATKSSDDCSIKVTSMSTTLNSTNVFNQCLQALENNQAYSISSRMKDMSSKRPSLKTVLQLSHPSHLLAVFHAYAVYTFLTQFFDIPNADALMNSISRDVILSETEWLDIIHKNSPHFDDWISNNPELHNFGELFHTFYISIPTTIEHYYQGESSKFHSIDTNILVKMKSEDMCCLLCNRNRRDDCANIPFVCDCCLYHQGIRMIGMFIDIFTKGVWKTYKIINFNSINHHYLLMDLKSVLCNVDLLNACYCLRTKSDLYYEMLSNERSLILTQYKTELKSMVKEKYKQGTFYCKVCFKVIDKNSLMYCNCCNNTYHEKCSHSTKLSDNTIWFCNSCLNNTFHM